MLADVLGKRIATLQVEEGSAYGAALLAISGSEGARLDEVIREVSSVLPRGSQTYTRGYEIYRSLYPSLRGAFQALGGLS